MPDAPGPAGLRHAGALAVSWGDCDPAGIVFYPNYFRWFDACTHRMLDAVGLHHATFGPRFGAVGLSLVDAQATFVAPVRDGARLATESVVARLGTSSLTVEHTLSHAGEVVVRGREVRVWVARGPDGGLAAAPLPDAVRALLMGSTAGQA